MGKETGFIRKSIPCPDNIPGCAVLHYKWEEVVGETEKDNHQWSQTMEEKI